MRTPRRRKAQRRLNELAWEAALVLAFSLAGVGFLASVWSPPSSGASSGYQPVFAGSLSNSGESAIVDTISVRVTAAGSLRNIIHGTETQVAIPKGGTVRQVSNRLTERYPQLEPAAMLALAGGMLPMTLELQDGQTLELMPPNFFGLAAAAP